MLHTIEELRDSASEAELGERLGLYLGLVEPVPRPVVRRAIVDARFCRYLLTSRGRPDTLAVLFRAPDNARYADAEPAAPAHTSWSLAKKAGAAFARWGAAGFQRVDDATFEARFDACKACDRLVAPPDSLLYKVRLGGSSDPRVCSACGCPAARKARLPTEHCPVEDPRNPGHNHWGEPLPAA